MSHPTSTVSRPHPGAGVWFGLLAAPTAWIVQGLTGWLLGAAVCASWSVGFVRVTLGVVGVCALAMALAGLTSSLRRWHDREWPAAAMEQPGEFFVFGGVFVSSAFAVGIVWATLNAAFINACGVMR